MSVFRLVPYGPEAIGALRAAIDRAKGDDALAPVTVAIPSNYAGLSLRRKLAAENERGLVNVRFYVLPRVAELLGAPLLAAQGRKPLTTPVRSEAVRAVLADDPGDIFRDVAEHAATERSLDSTFRDLRNAPDSALDAIAARSARATQVVRLYRAFRQRTEAYYDEQELAEAAALAVSSGTSALRDVGHVVLYLPRRLSPAEHALLDALAAAHGLSAIIGLTGDDGADSLTRQLAETLSTRLGAADEASPGQTPAGNSVVAVTDAEEEIRTAIRLIIERLEQGVPLHRIAVLYPLVQPYALLAHEQFHAANVPHNGPAVRTLAQTLSGRTLLGLLRLREQDFRRDAVMDWLSAAPVLEAENGRPVAGHRWDTISRAAGVVRGAAQWRERLERHTRTLQEQHEYVQNSDDTKAGQLERIDGDIERVKRLAAFIDELAKRVDTRSLKTWAEFGTWARELLTRYMGGEGHRETWPEDELQAHRTVEEALESLSALDDVRAETNESTFRRALERELERPAARVGRFGDGVFIGHIGDALGTDFDLVIVVGMAEGALPPRSRDDPLLPDRERAAGGDDVPLRSRRAAEERRAYLAALASAPERILIYPRADLRGQRGKLPAPWLLETASRLEGKQVFSAELEKLVRPWFSAVPSFEAALTDGHEPASEQEYDLRSLLRWPRSRPVTEHYLVEEKPALRDGLLAGKERQSARLSRWDGQVGPIGDLAPSKTKVVSPTALQDWATCPFRFFLGRVLYVAETSAPEDTLTLSALERGNLLHKALERFVLEQPARTSPAQPWSDGERAQLIAIGEELCNQAEAAGLTGKRILWQLARARILRDLHGFLDSDEELRGEFGVLAEAVELSFGMRGEEPIVVQLDDRAIAFRGRIDRVDRAPDGSRLVVIDYKSGSTYGYKDLSKDVVQRGTSLQLPVYALAATQRYGDVKTSAYYWFVTEQADYERKGGDMDDRTMERFQDVLGTIGRGIESGVFPARPGARDRDGGWEHCKFCAYDRACPSDRTRVWERKRGAPEAREYVALAEANE
jgi:hypothetical protein